MITGAVQIVRHKPISDLQMNERLTNTNSSQNSPTASP
jgi:hypothetical protein